MSTTNSDSDSEVPHPFYTETNRKSYNSQHDVAEAWADGLYPTHNVRDDGSAILYTGATRSTDQWGRGREAYGTSNNFYGIQEADGSGVLMHYTTREAIRLVDGTIISNEQCWSAGFAHCTTPADTKFSVPFDAVENFLDDEDTVFDIVDVWGQGDEKENSFTGETYYDKSTTNSVVIIDGENHRYGVFLGRDQSIINGNRNFAFRLNETELTEMESMEVEEIPNFSLRPPAVQASELRVVDSREYTKSYDYSDNEWLEAHKEAGGKTTMVERRREKREMNMQQYRADLQGNVIVRHGEWFFIPQPDMEPEDVGNHYASEQLDSHRAERFHGARSPLPEECSCGASSFEIGYSSPRFGSEYADDITCTECGNDIERRIYVHGQIRHTDNDHNAVNLGDTWHRAVQHNREVMVYDDNPVAGRRGGGGWD